MVGNLTQNGAKLKRIFIEPKLPEGLKPLAELSQNLWWSWNHDATDLFKSIDPARFEAVNFNPIALLDELSIERAQDLLADKEGDQDDEDGFHGGISLLVLIIPGTPPSPDDLRLKVHILFAIVQI